MRLLLLICSMLVVAAGQLSPAMANEAAAAKTTPATNEAFSFVLPKEKPAPAANTNIAEPKPLEANPEVKDESSGDDSKGTNTETGIAALPSQPKAFPGVKSGATKSTEVSNTVHSEPGLETPLDAEAMATALVHRLSTDVAPTANILPEKTNQSDVISTLQLKLDMARTFRKSQDYSHAEIHLVSILEDRKSVV